jgi:hypothetical protein
MSTMKRVLSDFVVPAVARLLFALVAGVWFGVWLLGPVVLFAFGFDDPRNIFSDPITIVGCGLLVLFWLYLVIHILVFGALPD